MAFVRLLKDLMKDKEIGKRFVPIIPDEARTFGMDSLFPTAKIYSPHGQTVRGRSTASCCSPTRSPTKGQILHEGISEAGSMASLIAAGHVVRDARRADDPGLHLLLDVRLPAHRRPVLALADQLGRGFLLGATAGRTTLTGEGLQHEDGHSLLLASTNPACVAYDPAWAFEIAHIVAGRAAPDVRLTDEHPHGEDVFYYLTVYNEPYQQPAEPEDVDVEGILKRHLPVRQARRARGRRRPARADPRVGRGSAVGAGGAAAARRGVGRRGRRLVGDLLERAAPRGGGLRGVQPAAPATPSSGCRT